MQKTADDTASLRRFCDVLLKPARTETFIELCACSSQVESLATAWQSPESLKGEKLQIAGGGGRLEFTTQQKVHGYIYYSKRSAKRGLATIWTVKTGLSASSRVSLLYVFVLKLKLKLYYDKLD
jgi:hypothetical protein